MRFLGRGFLRNPHKLPLAPCSNLLLLSASVILRNPHKLPLAPCSNLLLLSASVSKLTSTARSKTLRRDGDSNPGNTFGVYTLSRRASSTTRASLLRVRQSGCVGPYRSAKWTGNRCLRSPQKLKFSGPPLRGYS